MNHNAKLLGLAILGFILASASSRTSAAGGDEDFKSLFNGKDLAGRSEERRGG